MLYVGRLQTAHGTRVTHTGGMRGSKPAGFSSTRVSKQRAHSVGSAAAAAVTLRRHRAAVHLPGKARSAVMIRAAVDQPGGGLRRGLHVRAAAAAAAAALASHASLQPGTPTAWNPMHPGCNRMRPRRICAPGAGCTMVSHPNPSPSPNPNPNPDPNPNPNPKPNPNPNPGAGCTMVSRPRTLRIWPTPRSSSTTVGSPQRRWAP
jgi:hypothetical protein